MCNDLLRRCQKVATRYSAAESNCSFLGYSFHWMISLALILCRISMPILLITLRAPSRKAGSGHTAFYMKFWTLQQYFRQPALCYQAANWSNLCTSVDTLLDTFAGMKIEAVRDSSDQFYPYYLTSQRLLDLQLLDHRFRRALLVQLLVLLQYLVAHVKFKSADQQLKPDQADW
ncbi:hypothetical protein BOX15_Mlig024300g2 [Macrostomum lignano]|uniref:Uncharacterized protein n=1 Tax=Macrostomum lignano TaxID=282301 RepID=A0A267G2B1_9PLAT|nr:hypothetical protein BOX15_Mlig024300g2 [Macrostomum lignano]